MDVVELKTLLGTGQVLECNIPLDDAPIWDDEATYQAGDVVIVDGGTNIYKALASNAGSFPPGFVAGDAPLWQDLGYVNKWRMFDEYVDSATSGVAAPGGGTVIQVVLRAGMCDFVGLFGVSADAVSLELLAAEVEGQPEVVMWSQSIDLVEDDCLDWHDYFFGDFFTRDRCHAFFPIYFDTRLRVTVTAGGTAEVGNLVIGRTRHIGVTVFDLDLELLSFSRKATDDFGRTYLAQGAVVPSGSFEVLVETAAVHKVINQVLRGIDGLRAVFLAGNAPHDVLSDLLLVFGFLRGAKVTVPGPVESTLKIDIETLT